MNDDETFLTVVTVASSSMRGDQVRRLVEEGIPLGALQQGFSRFLENLQRLVAVAHQRTTDFTLDEVTFSAEIGVDGEFKLLGSGVGASATSAITFTLRRQSTVPS